MTGPTNKPRFELRQTPGVEVSSEELLADLKRVATESRRSTVTMHEYQAAGRYSTDTFRRRFGSWNKALTQAGLEISNEIKIDKDRLFENLERLWIAIGRQPTKRELGTEQSEFSEGPYTRVFGSWRKALQAFVEWANADAAFLRSDMAAAVDNAGESLTTAPREPNLRIRFQIMKRDGFRCKYCGKSPATHAGVELVLDHVHPWSKGGKTTPDNLVTSCVACNAGKFNS